MPNKSFEWEKQSSPSANGGLVVRNGAAGFNTGGFGGNGNALGNYGGARPLGPMRMISPSLVLRFKWTILTIFLLVAGAGTTAVWMFIIPQYRATATIQVSPVIPVLLYELKGDNGQIPYYQQYLNSQVGIIRSDSVMSRVLMDSVVKLTPWYKEGQEAVSGWWGTPLSQTERLDDILSVSPRARTQLIDISVTARRAKDAASIANIVLDQYVKATRELSSQNDQLTSELLYKRMEARRAEIGSLTEKINKIKKDMGVSSPDVLLIERTKRMEEKEAELENLRQKLAMVQYQQKELEALASAATSRPSNNDLRYLADAEWRKHNTELKTTQSNLELQQNRLGDSNPQIIALRKQIDTIKELMQTREQQIDEQWRAQLGEATVNGETTSAGLALERNRQQMKGLRFQEQMLVELVANQRKSVEELRESAAELSRQQVNYDKAKEEYEEVADRVKKKDAERNVPPSIQVVSRASTPTQPFHDRRLMFTGLAVFGGLALGLSLAYVRAMFSPSIQEVTDLTRAMPMPSLGELPLLRDSAKRTTAASTVVAEPAPEAFAENESIRMVRTALLQRLNGQRGGSVVLVTSAGPGAGKTTMTLHLARSLAQCGKKVLLVDADLHNPSATTRLKLAAGPGLIDLLSGRATDTQAILGTETPGLNVLPAGQPHNGHDMELLANGAFSGSLHQWRQRYDIVLLDSPAVLPVADAQIMSREADGTIMVVREGHCRYAEVSNALNCLQVAGGKLLGTVFIGSVRRSAYGYGYGYGNGGKYAGAAVALDVKPTRGQNA